MTEKVTGVGASLPSTVGSWGFANLLWICSTTAIWLVLCLGAPCIAENTSQQGAGRLGAKDAARITATPTRVKVSDGVASTVIAWNTGDGSQGFVFVKVNGRAPALVATAPEGSQSISWIRRGNYVFELYREAERRTLLGSVNVSGVATESEALSQRTGLSRHQMRYLLAAVLLVILYTALYLSSTGQVRTKFPIEPASSPHPLHVTRNLLLGAAAFICVDGLVFHTELYTSILAPESYAGRMAAITRAEKNRISSGLKEVLVLGDSRMAEGFSAAVADTLSSVDGLKFVNLAEPASAVNIWDYMLRDVDPAGNRYSAIVVPYGVGFEPHSADNLRISMAAPLLRYADCFNFASAFQRWSGRCRAFTACILRGSAFQSDVVDFLEDPMARFRSIQREPRRVQSRNLYQGRNYDIVGTSYDPNTGQVTFPPRLTEAQREAIRDSLTKPSQSETQDFLRMQREGIQRILNRYSASSTKIVLTPVPRGPFAGLPGASMTFHAVFPGITPHKAVFSVPEQTFDFLEKPEYYFDGFHLNAKGRQQFTETLVAELLQRLRSVNSDGRIRSHSSMAVGHFTTDCEVSNVFRPSSQRLSNGPTEQGN
ncbi:MAG: hypothetical protein DME65_08445 [Verrucomicrobia bacterium]|nr:MAG: hypothetical protein DME65_08445 [Verrucomicrobiota bacterium]